MKVFVTTQMRVGSTWLVELLTGILGTGFEFWERGRDITQERFDNFIHDAKGNRLVKLHYAHPKTICNCIPNGSKETYVISITRDIKDIAVSKILYMRYDKPMRFLSHLKEMEEVRKNFDRKNLTDKDYVNEFIKTQHFKHIVRNWKMYNDGYTHPNYFLTDYETLSKRRLFVCKQLCDFLHIKKTNQQLKFIIQRNNFMAKTGRKQGQEVSSAFRRKGIVGDYQNYLTQNSLKIINELVETL